MKEGGQVRVLDLAGLFALGEAAERGAVRRLEHLGLRGNRLGTEGVRALIPTLCSMPGLTSLDISQADGE